MSKIRPDAPVSIGCAICLNTRGTRTPATTVVHGYAVCDEHVELAEQPGFSTSLMERRLNPL